MTSCRTPEIQKHLTMVDSAFSYCFETAAQYISHNLSWMCATDKLQRHDKKYHLPSVCPVAHMPLTITITQDLCHIDLAFQAIPQAPETKKRLAKADGALSYALVCSST